MLTYNIPELINVYVAAINKGTLKCLQRPNGQFLFANWGLPRLGRISHNYMANREY